jgi:hypothetical protein
MSTAKPANQRAAKLPPAVQQRARRYRLAAAVILSAGLVSAGLLYWLCQPEADYSDDPSMIGFNRPAERAMESLYGKQGQLIEGLNDWLSQRGSQALLVVVGAGILAVICFQFARVVEHEAMMAEEAGRSAGDKQKAP